MHMQQATTGTPVQGVPSTRAELHALYDQRGELQSQLKTITRRRNELLEQQQGTQSSEALRDFQQRIRAIDQRAAEIDRELLRVDKAVSTGLAQLGPEQPAGPEVAEKIAAEAEKAAADAVAAVAGQSSTQLLIDQAVQDATQHAVRQTVGMSAMVVVAAFVLYRGFQRFFARSSTAQIPADSRRIDQLQQSIDVIALEVERMSESQRYVAKILNEKLPALGIGDAKDATPAKR